MPVGRRSLAAVVDRLIAAGCVAAEEEAEELVGAAPDTATLDAWLTRREHGEPLAWIVGAVGFCGRRVVVEPGVYVPRPQTEELARRAGEALPEGGWAADLCTGTGAIAAHLARSVRGAKVVGVDIDEAAVHCARRNGVAAAVGDVGRPLVADRFDVVVAVAPYVPSASLALLPRDARDHEPLTALDGGPDGLDLVRRIVEDAAHLLCREGWLFLEIGGDQDRALAPSLAAAGFTAARPWFDEDGDLRGLAAQHVAAIDHGRPAGV